MPELRFDAPTHAELVSQVRVWLASVDAEGPTLAGVVDQSATLTKDALVVVAQSAPAPVAASDVVTGLTEMGHKMTDATRDRVIASLDAVERVTDGTIVHRATKGAAETTSKVLFSMNSALAKQFLRQMAGDSDGGAKADPAG